MSTAKDKELICYSVQHNYDPEDSEGEGTISIAVNDVIEVQKSDLPDGATEEHPLGMFWQSIAQNFLLYFN